MARKKIFKKMAYKTKSVLLNILGDIQYYKYPLFLIYNPTTFKIKHHQARVAEKMIQPGDIILRRYDHYMDGLFIPGKYSHTGIYIGNGMMIHAIAEGVQEIDIGDFLRCDGFIILRPSSGQEVAIARAKKMLGRLYDFNFAPGSGRLYCHEVGAVAYRELNVQRFHPTFLGFTFKKLQKVFIDKSFLTNKNFTPILEM